MYDALPLRFPKSVIKHGVFALLVAVLLTCTTVASMPQRVLRAQPELLDLATQQPDATVRVVVQKIGYDLIVERLVAQLGGHVTKNLHLINAFAADLPAQSVPALARSEGVRWISFDVTMVEARTGCSGCISTAKLYNASMRVTDTGRLE